MFVRHCRFALLLGSAALLAACAFQPSQPSGGNPTEVIKLDPVAAAEMISSYRRAHGLAPVVVDPALEKVAQAQADAMAAADHLSHEVRAPLSARLDAAHLPKGYAVENVSAGYASAESVFAGWRRSPPHNANLLDAPMRRMGIAEALAPTTHYKTFWALVMTD